MRKKQQQQELKRVRHKDLQTGHGKCMAIWLTLPQQQSLWKHHQNSHLQLLPLLLSWLSFIQQNSSNQPPSISVFLHLPQQAVTINTTTK
ncbi:hypothetical protein CsSME_00007168 [Camellia sinensis var. sinensis]